MESLALAMLTSLLLFFMFFAVWRGLRRKDSFWDEPRKTRRTGLGARPMRDR